MKKIISILIISILLLSNFVFASNNDTVKSFLDNRSSYREEFTHWSKLSDFTSKTLFTSDLQVFGMLYERKKDDVYIIYDQNKDMIVEYSQGESPYSSLLEEYKVKKKINLNNKKAEYLIYEGPTYYSYILEKENNSTEYHTDFAATVYADKENAISNESIITSSPSYEEYVTTRGLTSKFIYGVADLKWYIGCSPTSGANLMYYWASNGYPNLTSGMTSNQVIENLASFMGTNHSTGGTSPSDVGPGIINYIESQGYNNFSYTQTTYPSFSNIMSEIDANRPALVGFSNHSTYGTHTSALVGYECGTGPNVMIIHDTWSSTPTKVYVAHYSTTKYLRKFWP